MSAAICGTFEDEKTPGYLGPVIGPHSRDSLAQSPPAYILLPRPLDLGDTLSDHSQRVTAE